MLPLIRQTLQALVRLKNAGEQGKTQLRNLHVNCTVRNESTVACKGGKFALLGNQS